MVEGVDEVHYSNKIVVREIKDAAKENLATNHSGSRFYRFLWGSKDWGALRNMDLIPQRPQQIGSMKERHHLKLVMMKQIRDSLLMA